MAKCVICGTECKAECCSGACRAKKSRRTQQRTQAKRTVKAHAAQGLLVDATGQRHKIDYARRVHDYNLLEDWAEGKGTPYQLLMGRLARQYRTVDVARYLGKTG